MTERINAATATATSGTFSPTGDFSVQADIPVGSSAVINVEGQADAAAPWVSLGGISASTIPPMRRFAKCPNVRLTLSGNSEGKSIKAWSGE
ncbi:MULTISPECIES: hypothetical protein [Agrobacterium]|uniref:Uncharacterized protein n=1 Tax=Agrobacterium salinitolerans TaxID=1183413 RepID=A0ABY3BVT4_9HYPH|nr:MULTISPECIES: hypothetical protein [Agrobacterium]TRA97051.1 hypothetical protein EXN23_02115 [Agrobacterium salinitolerans]